MADHVIVNVEAQLARRMWDEAEEHAAKAAAARDAAVAGYAAAEGERDPLERARLLRDAAGQERLIERHSLNAEAARAAARNAVARAVSLPDGADPAALDPVTYKPVTKRWEADRQKAAVEDAARELRAERDARLAACDWTQQPDAPVTDKQRAAWAKYRQALRDLPADTKDPRSPAWPPCPTG